MKVIELLNKIANGEEVSKKIKTKNDIWIYDEDGGGIDYKASDGRGYMFEVHTRINKEDLNEEIEIIEEDKKDEEIEIYVNGEKIELFDYEPLKQGEYFYKENGKWYVHKLKYVSKIIEEDNKIENIKVKSTFTRNQKQIARKINQIIDHINKGD